MICKTGGASAGFVKRVLCQAVAQSAEQVGLSFWTARGLSFCTCVGPVPVACPSPWSLLVSVFLTPPYSQPSLQWSRSGLLKCFFSAQR